MKNVLLLGNHGFPCGGPDRRLSLAGCKVITAADDDAMLSLQSDGMPVDLVIVDHESPDASDESLLRYVRHVAPRVPVIILSDSESIETYLKAIEFGAFEYLNKPVTVEELRRVAATAMRGKSAGKGISTAA